jgi:hypothetical protein
MPGKLVFQTTSDGGTSPTDRMTIFASGGASIGDTTDPGLGNLRLGIGNLVIATSGKGIDFSATAGTGTSELLADYEEGTWTTAVSDGTTSVTGGTGYYVKVGKIVTCSISFYNKNISGLAASGLRITGLPFANNGTYGGESMIYGATGANNAVGIFIGGSNTFGLLYFGSSGENASGLTKSSFNSATNASLWGTIIYQTA